MATDALGPSNAPDDDGLETPDKILSSQLSTGGAPDQTLLHLRLARHGNDAHCSNSCKRTPLWVWRRLFHVQIKAQHNKFPCIYLNMTATKPLPWL